MHGLPSDFQPNWFKIDYFPPVMHFSLCGVPQEKLPMLIDAVKEFKPKGLRGYSSYLFYFAKAVSSGEIEVDFIISGSEILLPHERKFLEERFSGEVFDVYGSREFGFIACECSEHAGYHVNAENLLIEIVDKNGEHCAPGEHGRILITDLTNHVFPFIRYEIGDIGCLSDERCPCGRSLPLLSSIDGRTGDRIITPDGKLLSLQFFAHLLKDYDIINFQVIQSAPNKIVLNIERGSNYNDATDTARILHSISSFFPSLNITLNFVDKIPRCPSGKRKIVIVKLKHRGV